jgi:NtrC-family two-component system response regulator AlgB
MRQILLKVTKNRQLQQRVEDLEQQVASSQDAYDFSSDDPVMEPIIQLLNKVAPTTASVLILGENGTGKSVLACEVHRRSARKKEPFVTISCPSLSRELLESELFGHVKGSFTGAVQDKPGKVEVADGGTLFLDEIGELPIEIQPKLLRLLQEKEFERLGDHRTRKANVRVIAATNRDIESMVLNGTFREDLYYRLNVITMKIPSLRERKASIKNLSNQHLDQLARSIGRDIQGFTNEAHAAIESYPWPGNLRELRNALERAVILSDGPLIDLNDLPMLNSENTGTSVFVGSLVTLEDIERAHIKRVLARCTQLDEAAQVLGIDAATLYRKRKRYGID